MTFAHKSKYEIFKLIFLSFCLWLPDVISYPIHPTHVEILNLSHKSQSHVLSDKQMLIKATCIVLQGKQDDQKCENVRHVSYLNTISKQNRIKHRNRCQMLVRTCFLVGCLFLTFSIALKIVLFCFFLKINILTMSAIFLWCPRKFPGCLSWTIF